MVASATAEQYQQCTRLLLADGNVDALLVIFIPPLVTRAEDVARAIVAGAAGTTKPILTSFMGARGAPSALAQIPSYRFPEAAVVALSHATTYGAWRRRPRGSVWRLDDGPRDVVRTVINSALTRGEGWLTPIEAQALLEAIGIPIAGARLVTTEDEAVAAAGDVGYPVALKAAGPEILHKTDVGGVILDIRDESGVRNALRTLRSRVGETMTAAVVQQMVPGGVELLIGAVVDPTFGPLVACGSGGVLVDILRDTVLRLHPITDLDATDMIDGLKGAALLRGYRGHPPADKSAVVDALQRVSALLEHCPEIQELDVNPLKVLEHGVKAVDVRIRLSRREPRPPTRRVSY
jgi:acyl-CoA synthetase (NDP forming)